MSSSVVSRLHRPLFHLVFWSWNALFGALVYFGLVPLILGSNSFFRDLDDMPKSFAVFLTLIFIVPGAALTAGIFRFRREPTKLIHLLYAVEAPVLLLSMARVFLFRQLNGPTTLLFWALIVGTCAHAALLWMGPERKSRLLLAGQTIGVLVAAYVAVILMFFVFPLAATIIGAVFDGSFIVDVGRALSRADCYDVFMSLVAVFFFACSSTLILALPFAFILCHYRGLAALMRAAIDDERGVRAIVTVATTTVAAIVTAAVVLGGSPGRRGPETLARLATPPTSAVELKERLGDADTIRDHLVDAHLARYRYLTAKGGLVVIRDMYRDVLPSACEGCAERAQEAFEDVVAPFLYNGDEGDVQRSERQYAEFFDESIQRGERAELKDALNATFERVDVPANLLDIDERAVHLVSQSITVRQDDFAADIELFEVYENRTYEDIEILYYFTLPDTAVVTGLWLNERAPDKGDAFEFRVSPRGAAQRVYEAEVRRRVDPALLEQVGPQQYRLRVFPIPAKRDDAPRRMHLWLTYRTLPVAEGWPLPRLLEARNVFWDDDTVRTVRGEATDGEDAWAQDVVEGHVPDRVARAFAVGGMQVVATPLEDAARLPRGGRNYAVVVDRSYSMHEVDDELVETFDWLREEIYPRANVDVYLTSAPSRGEVPSRIDDANAYDATSEIFYGGQSTASMLRQAVALAEDADLACPFGKTGIDCYDAVLFLTDAGRIELEEDGDLAYGGAAPLWFVHLGGRVAMGYDDAVTEAIQKSAGGITTRVEDVFAHFALAESRTDAFIGFGGGYVWSVAPGEGESERLDPIAARQFVRGAIQTQDVSDRNVLDRIHRVATRAKIVTPYSSMIVLVMDRQHQALDLAEKGDDRFDRRTSTDASPLAQPNDMLGLTGTPEPEVWALLLMGAAMLWVMRRGHLNFGFQRPN